MTHPHAFRFGVTAVPARSGRELREAARRAEDLGYTSLFMPDHYVGTELEPLTAISYVAAVSDTLKIGTLVLANDFRHPALLAKHAATLDLLSEGRLELGLGAGWLTADYDAVGLQHDDGATRVARLAEAVEVMKRAWKPDPFDFRGDHYTITAYDGRPKPATDGGPRLLMAGGGPSMLRLAGREADIVGVNPNLRAGVVGPDAIRSTLADVTARKLAWIREGAGERIDDIELQVRYFFAAVSDDARGLAEAVAPGFGVTPDEALGSSIALVGTIDAICDTLVERRERWGISYVVLGWDVMEAFAPAVARLAGS